MRKTKIMFELAKMVNKADDTCGLSCDKVISTDGLLTKKDVVFDGELKGIDQILNTVVTQEEDNEASQSLTAARDASREVQSYLDKTFLKDSSKL
jgi:small nuclear ribonucleoprotein (snRNP)-like protein